MSNLTLGVIGCGNMGLALIKGIKSNLEFKNISVFDKNKDRAIEFSNLGVTFCENNAQLVKSSDIIILAVKPNVAKGVLSEIKSVMADNILISIVAGLTTSAISQIVGDDKKIIRVMPNTPAMVNAGFSAVCKGGVANDNDEKNVIEIFSALGKAQHVDENKFDAVTALTGSSPAFIFQIIEAMSDAGVYMGLDRKTSIEMAAQAVLGSGKMAQESNIHPAVLKDMVASPSGTTIEGVYELERSSVRAGIMNAILASYKKAQKI